jgi:hypothetical protein
MKKILGINADTAGFWTSLLCAIHCSALPILLALGQASQWAWLHNHAVDWIIIGIGIVIAAYSLLGDYRDDHQNPRPLIMAGVAFTFLMIGMIHHHGWMLVFSVSGGLLLATAHVINHRLTSAHRAHA